MTDLENLFTAMWRGRVGTEVIRCGSSLKQSSDETDTPFMMAQTAAADETLVWNILNRNLFFVKDAVQRSELETSDKFDIYDPATRELLVECREPNIGALTKVARAFGGEHDHGSPFDFVGRFPGSEDPLFRVKRGSTSLGFGGTPMEFFDHENQRIGRMKKKIFALGLKFVFSEGARGIFILQIKSKVLSSARELLMENKTVARIVPNWKSDHGDFFKEGGFSHAISIAPDFPVNSPARQLLLAFCAAIHRVNA